MRKITIINYLFTLLGLGMIIIAIYLFKNTQDFLKTAKTAEGTVIELVRSRSSDSVTYKPVVEFYTQDDKSIEFTSSSGSNPPSFSKGEIVEVLYQESFPEKAKINSFFSLWGGVSILGGIGSVFFIIGISMFLAKKLKAQRIEYLKQHGVAIKAKFDSIQINHSFKVNGRSPYQIYLQWKNPKTSEVHIFKSENIWFDPAAYIKSDELTVVIERNNPSKYFVDISFLPKLAN